MINELAKIMPDIRFLPGERFSWSPVERKITYTSDQIEADGRYALLHETGHAMLGHSSYTTDVELLKMEVAAWEKAKELATTLGFKISEEHIQQCLDSYRDWLYRRSTCPTCGTNTLQNDLTNDYRCFNCHAEWEVSPSRFCRAYRSRKMETEFVLL
jgi:predicted Zn-ribbon and HTH transcriptional regulator